jgi:small subunit ribosomal protein S6
MFIFDSNQYARDPGGVSGRLAKIVQDCGGELLVSRLWAEQKFAYPIDGHRKGTYWLTYFRMDSNRQKDFLRQCQLNDNILRNLVLTVDNRLVDALVQHALSGGGPALRSGSDDGDEPRRGRRIEPVVVEEDEAEVES